MCLSGQCVLHAFFNEYVFFGEMQIQQHFLWLVVQLLVDLKHYFQLTKTGQHHNTGCASENGTNQPSNVDKVPKL